ncbi:MAG TPA: EVE domain-containing protein [Nitrospira sp.]|nr:EVE domain-containing protein [Nitrospira sp.]
MRKSPQYWLMKSEPSVFSIHDLEKSLNRTTSWDGVRNYQARNFMREMAIGDLVFFYHSNADPPAVAGIAEVVRTAYPDDSQFDRSSPHYDPDSQKDAPRWDMVDIRHRETFPEPVALDRLRGEARLKNMVLLQKGSRLSVQPVSSLAWAVINELAQSRRRRH